MHVKYRFEFQGVPEETIETEGGTFEACRDKAKALWHGKHKNLPKTFGCFRFKD